MPKYFFNTRIGNDLVRDPEGIELRNPDHAWEVARATIRDLLSGKSPPRHLLSATLEVTDIAGETVLEFPFTEALLDTASATRDKPSKH